jgi:hypothetical protein
MSRPVAGKLAFTKLSRQDDQCAPLQLSHEGYKPNYTGTTKLQGIKI